MTFLLPTPVTPSAEALLRQACFAGGYDQTPVPTQTRVEDGRLVVARGSSESGAVSLPWPVGAGGALVTATATLRERPEPYNLLLELARGKLNQVRNQTAEWLDIGLQTPPDFDQELAGLVRLFGAAVLDQPSAAADAVSSRVLDRSYHAADRLVRMYVDQMFATRHDEEGMLPTRLAARFAAPPADRQAGEYRRAFNAARVGFRWRDIEPAESQYNWAAVDQAVAAARADGLPITIGPVIDLAPGMVPAWAERWERDLPTLAAFMCDFLETFIGRYRGQVRRWVVCGGFNLPAPSGLADDERLRLVQRLFESALNLDSGLELVLSVAQPWGDYLSQNEQAKSPLSFTDDLIRTGLRVSAVELEVRCGNSPRGSLPRDLLDTSRLIDLYSMLGPALEVVLSHPASAKADPAAIEHAESLWLPAWRGSPTPEGQAEWGASFAALALCKPQVRAVTWDHWSDAGPHLTPTGGLVDASGRPKPLLARLQALRTMHLE